MEQVFFIECGVRRRGIRVTCRICSTPFVCRVSRPRDFCSRECSSKAREKRVRLTCRRCGKAFERPANKAEAGRRRHGVQFCSRKCKDLAQRLTGNCPEIRPPHYGTGAYEYRHLVNFEQGCCGRGERRTFLLFVHHLDGDRKNNAVENLEIVCGNCHIIRHLELVDGEWAYKSSALTPRAMIPVLTAWSHRESNPDLRLAKASSSR